MKEKLLQIVLNAIKEISDVYPDKMDGETDLDIFGFDEEDVCALSLAINDSLPSKFQIALDPEVYCGLVTINDIVNLIQYP